MKTWIDWDSLIKVIVVVVVLLSCLVTLVVKKQAWGFDLFVYFFTARVAGGLNKLLSSCVLVKPSNFAISGGHEQKATTFVIFRKLETVS